MSGADKIDVLDCENSLNYLNKERFLRVFCLVMIGAYTVNLNLIQKSGNSRILIKILTKVMAITVWIDRGRHKQ